MILHTERLVLRRAGSQDLPDLHTVYGHPDAMRYWSTPPDSDINQTRERLDRQIAAPEPVCYFVIEKDGRVIGNAGMHSGSEVGFILHPDCWRQGIVTEAMQAIIPYLWQITDAPALTADADPLNTASVAALKSLGFIETHRAERTFCINGVWSDSVYLCLDRPQNSA